MDSSGRSIDRICLALTVFALGICIATQWVANALGNSPRLGRPWLDLWDAPIYAPWQLFVWWLQWGQQAPRVFDTGGAIVLAGGVAAGAVGVAWRSKPAPNKAYGSARWASKNEVASFGLTANAGIFLGRQVKHYLRHDGPEHVMTFAPTRSGKGVGLVVPTLLSWPHSVVVHDIKGENWQLTAGWRARFSHCLRFDPTDARSAAYNPLLEVRRGT